jgi:MEMO1 family protein
MFYQAEPHICRRDAEQLFAPADLPADLPDTLFGGILPHAGWAYSGRLAALTLKALLDPQNPPKTVVLLGADHTGSARLGELWAEGAWQTPLGDLDVDADLADNLLHHPRADGLLRDNPQAHVAEHSLEVQAPLIAFRCPEARILPLAVPPTDRAVTVGELLGEVLAERPAGEVTLVGSTDLTHHGGHFGHPGGRGEQSEAFARQNDRRMLDRIEAMDAPGAIAEAREHRNACGAGAIAAAIAAASRLGATSARLLEYTNSYVIVHEQAPYELDDTTVGYASVVFC